MNYFLNRNRSFLRGLVLPAALTALVSGLSMGQSTFAFQGLYGGNGGNFTSLDGHNGPNGAGDPFITSRSFTGLDSQGNQQTMLIQGSATSSASYGKIHVKGQGTILNPYYNSANTALFDGNTYDENGSPDLLAINGNAGWSDSLNYTGLTGTGFKVNFYFRLEGTTSGDIEAGLNFYTSDGSAPSYNPRTKGGGALWITPFYQMDSSYSLNISADFYAGLNTYVSGKPEGQNILGYADYGNTLEMIGMKVYDASGNEVKDFGVTSASGTSYPTQAVPEPGTMTVCLAAAAMAKRRKRKQS